MVKVTPIKNSRLYSIQLLLTHHSVPPGNYSRLACQFLFERSLGYYIIHIYVPSSLVVVLSWVSFWLHRDSAPARTTLGITTVLTMATLISSTNASLPKINYLKSVDVYLVACFFMVFASILEYACVSYIGRSSSCFGGGGWNCIYATAKVVEKSWKTRKRNGVSTLEAVELESRGTNRVFERLKPKFQHNNESNEKHLDNINISENEKNNASRKKSCCDKDLRHKIFVCCCYDTNGSYDDISNKAIFREYNFTDMDNDLCEQNRIFHFTAGMESQEEEFISNNIQANYIKPFKQAIQKAPKDSIFCKSENNYDECNVFKYCNSSEYQLSQSDEMKTRVRNVKYQLYKNIRLLFK